MIYKCTPSQYSTVVLKIILSAVRAEGFFEILFIRNVISFCLTLYTGVITSIPEGCDVNRCIQNSTNVKNHRFIKLRTLQDTFTATRVTVV